MIEPKLFVSPTSENIIDSLLEISTIYPLGIIASRNQIDFNSGYVSNFNTESFFNYIKEKTSNVILCRDHGGKQNKKDNNDLKSLKKDCGFFDIIHIDAFKFFTSFNDSCNYTSNCIKMCLDINPNLYFEVGTEEAVFKYDPNFLDLYLEEISHKLSEKEFSRIKYAVGQSGAVIDVYSGKNDGILDLDKLLKFKHVSNKFKVLLKEHNGDYLNLASGIIPRFKNGLDAINIGPEFAQIENEIYFNSIKDREDLKEEYYKICLNSDLWLNWIKEENTPEKNLIIKSFGHYVFSELHKNQELETIIKQQKEKCKTNIFLKISDILCGIYGKEMFKKIIAFDLDDVICTRELDSKKEGPDKYLQCKPDTKIVDIVNRLYHSNYKICIYTSRGMNYFNGNKNNIYNNIFKITKNQLNQWGLKYHQIIMGKIYYDIFIDDKAVNSKDISLDKIENFLANYDV